MAVTSWQFVKSTTGASVSGIGTVAWSGPTNIEADDATRAIATSLGAGAKSYWLRGYFNFTTSDVPSGATIDGVEVEVDTYNATSYLCRFYAARIVIGGTINGTDVSGMPSTTWGNSPIGEGKLTLGGASNLWNATPTDSDVRGSTFGVAISVENYEASKTRAPGVDYIRMRIYYTTSAVIDAYIPAFATTLGLCESAEAALQGSRKIRFSSY